METTNKLTRDPLTETQVSSKNFHWLLILLFSKWEDNLPDEANPEITTGTFIVMFPLIASYEIQIFYWTIFYMKY